MIIRVSNHADKIRLIAIETMKGAFGNEGALHFYLLIYGREPCRRGWINAATPMA
jgi:hypothetical protein